jgi:hypothetical protein
VTCGDLVCDAHHGETCTVCREDYGTYSTNVSDYHYLLLTLCLVPRACRQDCNSHGKCTEGVCDCNVGWTGPACNSSMTLFLSSSSLSLSPFLLPVIVAFNTQQQGTNLLWWWSEIQPNATLEGSQVFSVLIVGISETDSQGSPSLKLKLKLKF